jgi:nucleotide-binding universal stress UspA family protein
MSKRFCGEGPDVPFRSIVVFLDPSANVQSVLNVALDLAGKHDAHLVGLQAIPKKSARSAAAEEASAIEGAFCEQATARHLSHEWCRARGDKSKIVVLESRAHDLLVIGHASPLDKRLWPQPNHLLESALLKSGRPLIGVPHQGAFAQVGERVLVGWSGAREAARAVEDAMPILEKASEVTVMTVDLRSGEALSIDHLVVALERHGVNVTVRGARNLGQSTGQTLLSEAHALDCDLLVMGGYGHSPIREHMFGGVTYFVIEHMTMPVFLSH